jgi:hypothetical protein
MIHLPYMVRVVVVERANGTLLVETVDAEGMTPWLASVASDELELAQRY